MDPALVRPLLWKDRALECQGEVEKAIETYQEVLEMEPGCEEAVDSIEYIKKQDMEVKSALHAAVKLF